MVTAEPGESMSEPNVPLSDFSDSDEDDGEYRPKDAVGSSDSSSKQEFACPIFETEEGSKTGMEANQISLDFESSVNIQAELSLRRSLRNISSKSKATVNYADYAAPRKLSSGKKRLPLEDEFLQLASLHIFPSNKPNKFYIGRLGGRKTADLQGG